MRLEPVHERSTYPQGPSAGLGTPWTPIFGARTKINTRNAHHRGIQSLVRLIPLFGPFSPEAFAMVPAFAPGFPLVGPLIVRGGEFLTDNPEVTAAAYDVAHPLETQGYATLAPLYEPVRPQVLAGEAQFAATVAPQVETFAGMPGATCLPAALALALS